MTFDKLSDEVAVAVIMAQYLFAQTLTSQELDEERMPKMNNALDRNADALREFPAATEFFIDGVPGELATLIEGWSTNDRLGLLIEIARSNPFAPSFFKIGSQKRKSALRIVAQTGLQLDMKKADDVLSSFSRIDEARKPQSWQAKIKGIDPLRMGLVGTAAAGVAVLAAPAIVVLLPAAVGLSGAAAVSAGLASLGGGAVAAGGAGMAGGFLAMAGMGALVGGGLDASRAFFMQGGQLEDILQTSEGPNAARAEVMKLLVRADLIPKQRKEMKKMLTSVSESVLRASQEAQEHNDLDAPVVKDLKSCASFMEFADSYFSTKLT